MAFADPLSFTPTGGSAITLNRTSSGDRKSGYSSSDLLTQLTISHDVSTQRVRHLLKLDQSKSVPDPIVPTSNTTARISAYTVFDVPRFGYTPAEVEAFCGGLLTFESASTFAILKKLLGNEN